MRPCFLAAWLVVVGGCATACPEPVRPAVSRAAPVRVVDAKVPLCWELLRSFEWTSGVHCRVIGVYVTDVFHGKGVVFGAWPVVHPERGTAVLLESLWSPEEKHDPGKIAGYMGKVVEVEGVLHRAPPRDGPENYAYAPTMSPVHAIRVVADRPPE